MHMAPKKTASLRFDVDKSAVDGITKTGKDLPGGYGMLKGRQLYIKLFEHLGLHPERLRLMREILQIEKENKENEERE